MLLSLLYVLISGIALPVGWSWLGGLPWRRLGYNVWLVLSYRGKFYLHAYLHPGVLLCNT